jgi:hypothetical protein
MSVLNQKQEREASVWEAKGVRCRKTNAESKEKIKTKRPQEAGGVAQAVGLPFKHEALSSNSSPTKKKERKKKNDMMVKGRM